MLAVITATGYARGAMPFEPAPPCNLIFFEPTTRHLLRRTITGSDCAQHPVHVSLWDLHVFDNAPGSSTSSFLRLPPLLSAI